MAQSKMERQKQKKRQARREKIGRIQPLSRCDEILILPCGGRASMSEALIDFMEIDGQAWPDDTLLRKSIVLGTVVWNAAVTSGAARNDLLQSTLGTLPSENRAEARHGIVALIKQKETPDTFSQKCTFSL